MHFIEFELNSKFHDFCDFVSVDGILLAHARIQKFKKYCKKESNLTKDKVFQKKLVLSHALIPRSIEQQENSPRTGKLSQKSTKN